MIDEKGKLFGKISIIDLLVILVIICAVGGCAYKLIGNNETVAVVNKDTFTTVIRVEELKDLAVDAVKEGEVVYEEHGGVLGTITEVRTEPFVKEIGSPTVDVLTYDDRQTIYITLACKGTINSKGYYSQGNAQLFVGRTTSIQSRLFVFKETEIDAVFK